MVIIYKCVLLIVLINNVIKYDFFFQIKYVNFVVDGDSFSGLC